MMLAENDKNAPKTIEKVCYEVNAPEKYKRFEELCHISEDDVYEMYVDTSADHGSTYFFTWQVTKSTFVDPIQPDQDVCTPIEVKGHNGFTKVTTIDLSDGRQIINNSVIWDCGDYIHFVNGSVSMEDLMSIIEGMTEK